MTSIRARVYRLSAWIGHRVVLLLCHKEKYKGLVLYANEHDVRDFAPLWLEKIRRGLELIERTAPITAARIYRDVECIVVDSVMGNDYVRVVNAVRLSGPGILHLDVTHVALIIIHEATHARIATRGIPYESQQRARHERACTRAEARFARKLPNGDALVEEVMRKLDTPWWTDDALRNRTLDEFDRLGLKGSWSRYLRRKITARRPKD